MTKQGICGTKPPGDHSPKAGQSEKRVPLDFSELSVGSRLLIDGQEMVISKVLIDRPAGSE